MEIGKVVEGAIGPVCPSEVGGDIVSHGEGCEDASFEAGILYPKRA